MRCDIRKKVGVWCDHDACNDKGVVGVVDDHMAGAPGRSGGAQ